MATQVRKVRQYSLVAGALVRRETRRRLQDMSDVFDDRGLYCLVREEKALLQSLFTIRIQENLADAVEKYLGRLAIAVEQM